MKRKTTRPSLAARVDGWLAVSPKRGPVVAALFTLLIWAPTLFLGLHYWDDTVYYFEDPRIASWSFANLWAILTKPFFANFHPLTTFSFLLDRTIWKDWVPGFHLSHLLFYSAAIALCYEWMRRIVGDRFWALVGAALFCAHALHVEPVAWLACRKDILSLVFYLAALIAYDRYSEAAEASEQWPWKPYCLVLIAMTLSLASKGYAVVLPAVFFAYDLCFSPRMGKRQLADKLPLLALAAAFTLFTLTAQDQNSALIQLDLPVRSRIEVLLKIFSLYVGRSILPIALNAKYVVSDRNWYSLGVAWLGFALLLGLFWVFFKQRKTRPTLSFCAALFILPLATTMNTFFTLRIWMTDRYLILPTLGICLAFAWAGSTWQEKHADRRRSDPMAHGALLLLVLFAGLSLSRTRVWGSLVELRSDSLRKNYAFLADGEGKLTGTEFRTKVKGQEVEPTLLDNLEELVIAYDREGDRLMGHEFRDFLRKNGRNSFDDAQNNITAGQPDKAIGPLTAAVNENLWNAPAAAKLLGDAYATKKDWNQARGWYRKAYDLHKQNGLSGAWPIVGELAMEFQAGEYTRALEVVKRLREEAPNDPRAPFFEGRALEELGKPEVAWTLYEVVEKFPESAFKDTQLFPAQVQRQMGLTAQKLGKKEEARKHFQEALRLDPNHRENPAIRQILEDL